MLFDNPTLAGQCNLAVGVPVPKALNPGMESVVPSGTRGFGTVLVFGSSLGRITGLQLLSCRKFSSWRGREEQWNSFCTLPPTHAQHVYLQCSPAAEVQKLY